MPPLYSEKRCPRNIGRHRRGSSMIARPTLLIRETLDNGDDEDADESDENISPDADKSSLRFTLERRRDNGDDDEDNNDGPGRNRGFGGDNPQSRQNGRQGDGQGDGPRFFHEKADGGDNKGGKGDGNPFNNGPGPGPGNNNNINNNSNNDNDNNDDNNDNNNNNNGDGGKGGGGSDNGNRGGNNGDGGGGDNNDDGRDGNKDGNGRGNGGGDGSDSNSDDNNSSTSLPPPPPPPPPPSTTSTSSTVEATTTTSDVIPTPSVVFTTSVITSVTTPETTTVSSTSQDSTIPTLTALPDSADPSDIPIFNQPAVSSSSIPGVSLSTSISDSSSPVPTPTEGANNRDNGNNSHGRNGNKSNGGNNRGPGGGLTSTSEQVLVAVGAIGVFIVLCFILWIVVRTLKKSKRSGRKYNDSSWLAGLIPGRKQPKPSNAPGFNSFYEKESLPAYDAGGKNSMEGYGYYDQTKLYPLEPENVSYPAAAAAAAARLQNEMAMRQVAESQQRQLLPNSVSQYPPQLNVQIGDSYNNDVNSTQRSRMPDAYYTQSQLSRQPSNTYNPTQRQVYRASEISSLSSGFGDGDIIMPPPNVIMMPKTPTAAVAAAAAARAPTNAEGNGNNRPFSWMSRAGTEQKRDTVYTTASDRRTRFHSVNSWVDQQKRRLMKAS